MKKVGVYLASGTNGGGVFQYCLMILESLGGDKNQVFCAVNNKEWINYLGKQFKRYKVIDLLNKKRIERVVDSLLALMPIWFPIVLRKMLIENLDSRVRMMKKVGVDLWIFPSQDQLCFESGLASLATIHDLMHRYERNFPEVSDKVSYNFREYLYRNICRYCNGILVDSEMGKKHVLESYREAVAEKIFVLPFIAPKYVKLVTKKNRLYLPDEYFIYPAQFWKHKNHENLVKAFNLIKNKYPQLCLIFCGRENNNYENILNLIKSFDLEERVIIKGYVEDEDMNEMYHRAIALILPTYFGPTNIPQLEAMAVGCPVAVSDVYGAREQLGDAALYFDPKSVREIAETMDILCCDNELRRLLIKRGYSKTKKWGQKQFSERLKQIIDKATKFGNHFP